MDNAIDDKMLANTPDCGPERFEQLPIDTVIEHVEKNNCLVSDSHIRIAKKLHK
jgi:hypothetical protein